MASPTPSLLSALPGRSTSMRGHPPQQNGSGSSSHRRWYSLPDSMLAGGGAGFVSSILMCPLDVIKTKLQAQTVRHGHIDYLGAMGTVKQIMERDGVRGLYRGLGPTLLGYLPTWAIYFTVYDGFKRSFGVGGQGVQETKRYVISNSWALHILAAMTAGATGTIITNPLWVIKTRFMTQPHTEPRYRSTLHAAYLIYRAEGLKAFYSGLAPSLLGVFHVAVQFPLYERLKAWQIEKYSEPLSATQLLLCSAVSKAVASVATYPHEVVRTRMQVQKRPARNGNGNGTGNGSGNGNGSVSAAAAEAVKPPSTAPRIPVAPIPTSPNAFTPTPPIPPAAGAERQYTGVVQTFVKIVADEGWRGLYKGLAVNLMRTVPNSIVTLVSYEMFMRALAEWHER